MLSGDVLCSCAQRRCLVLSGDVLYSAEMLCSAEMSCAQRRCLVLNGDVVLSGDVLCSTEMSVTSCNSFGTPWQKLWGTDGREGVSKHGA